MYQVTDIVAILALSITSSRTFMRSLASETESPVGLLLFDEPSASLDPRAEHGMSCLSPMPIGSLTTFPDLFERLRALRGNKTMIFSSHRFGNLTRHADLILYVLSFSFPFRLPTDGPLSPSGTWTMPRFRKRVRTKRCWPRVASTHGYGSCKSRRSYDRWSCTRWM